MAVPTSPTITIGGSVKTLTTTKYLRRLATVAALALMLVVAAPAAAAPGTFTVYSCGTPEQANGPAAGWTPSAPIGPYSEALISGCTGKSGTMAVTNGAAKFSSHSFAVYDGAALVFSAPAGQLVSRLWLDMSASVSSRDGTGGDYGAINMYPVLTGSHTGFLDQCKAAPRGGCFGGLLDWHGRHVRDAVREYRDLTESHVTIDVRCRASGTCNALGSEPIGVEVYRAEVDLTETPAAAPISSNAQGSLTEDGVLRGVEGISFQATDNASGVYRAILKVGDREFPVALDGTPPTCVDARPFAARTTSSRVRRRARRPVRSRRTSTRRGCRRGGTSSTCTSRTRAACGRRSSARAR
jgi:hypothetical protein